MGSQIVKVRFKYERLVKLCFYCWGMGHIDRNCDRRSSDISNDNADHTTYTKPNHHNNIIPTENQKSPATLLHSESSHIPAQAAKTIPLEKTSTNINPILNNIINNTQPSTIGYQPLDMEVETTASTQNTPELAMIIHEPFQASTKQVGKRGPKKGWKRQQQSSPKDMQQPLQTTPRGKRQIGVQQMIEVDQVTSLSEEENPLKKLKHSSQGVN
ncbi:P-selectin glycoprotein ligand 1 [Striga asiatica]|uniref:P-selectin glycoprotein ligand 1 n=1 Tax=Striga asiatica TaxID=4170 RepID=A0A5A7R5V3_STRAF|nr:P-selectin glycoprotein ligand 1 [Striga asiatica]